MLNDVEHEFEQYQFDNPQHPDCQFDDEQYVFKYNPDTDWLDLDEPYQVQQLTYNRDEDAFGYLLRNLVTGELEEWTLSETHEVFQSPQCKSCWKVGVALTESERTFLCDNSRCHVQSYEY